MSSSGGSSEEIDAIIANRGQDVEALFKLSSTMKTGMDRRSIACIMELIECGVDPDSIADLLAELDAMKHRR